MWLLQYLITVLLTPSTRAPEERLLRYSRSSSTSAKFLLLCLVSAESHAAETTQKTVLQVHKILAGHSKAVSYL